MKRTLRTNQNLYFSDFSANIHSCVLLVLLNTTQVIGKLVKCDQTPPQATAEEPSENKGLFKLSVERKDNDMQDVYLPDQTYVLILKTTNKTRPFRWFMITVEDPDVDNSINEYEQVPVDVGSLKTLADNPQSRYSEKCFNSVESADNFDKENVEIHWVSPKNSPKQIVRLRATVAENQETWYTDDDLTILLKKDTRRPLDSAPHPPVENCELNSEARYEIVFKGHWSRLTHPRYYPSKPDENGYSHMVGASHGYDYTLWQLGTPASAGLKLLAEDANITIIERDIINNMSATGGTRTLIRGKRRHHPEMFEPSYALFRADSIHHMFSVVVAIKPSPDWFLGASRFELCTRNGWLKEYKMPLYPWDAGTMDGVSYESPKSVTNPTDNIDRVEIGSFNSESPFYQMNLNDLKPFAYLHLKRLSVDPIKGRNCNDERQEPQTEDVQNEQESDVVEEPMVLESKLHTNEDHCTFSDWYEWSPCVPDEGICGFGTQIRTRSRMDAHSKYSDNVNAPRDIASCPENVLMESQACYVGC
ncbi:PREDICTED: spondin-2-like [Papilio xuthus]|uniref:Spondin-2-like n=1 Tax=Papilio xuthus TaxID=66420 RepID=A0AAJ6Z5V8_PAPXU|nr:PREDICTED: spondin-2-like [Papilio xuthus]